MTASVVLGRDLEIHPADVTVRILDGRSAEAA